MEGQSSLIMFRVNPFPADRTQSNTWRKISRKQDSTEDFGSNNVKPHPIQTHRGASPPACAAALASAALVSLFQSSSSSPCALIRDPSSHSGTTLRHFQLLPFPFCREFLNWQLEHDPNRRTDAIRQKKERVRGRQGQKQRRKEDAECFYGHVSLGDKRQVTE